MILTVMKIQLFYHESNTLDDVLWKVLSLKEKKAILLISYLSDIYIAVLVPIRHSLSILSARPSTETHAVS